MGSGAQLTVQTTTNLGGFHELGHSDGRIEGGRTKWSLIYAGY